MMMGDEAVNFGNSPRFYWYLYVTMVAVLTAVLVATCGIIGFVGLITPHLARGLVGSELQETFFLLRPCWAPSFVIWADVLSRIIIPTLRLVFSQPIGALYSHCWR